MNTSILYHYTGLEAFKSIISTGKIRASHFFNLGGDSQEVRYGIGQLRNAVQAHSTREADQDFKAYLLGFISLFEKEELEIYVLSFSSLSDSQRHWDTYAKGGVAIGFCRDRIQRGFPTDITRKLHGHTVVDPIRPNPANRFIPCRYENSFDLPGHVANHFFKEESYAAMFNGANSQQQNIGQQLGVVLNATIGVAIYRTICSLKRRDYLLDDEYRTVNFNPDEVDYPVITMGDRRHIEMQFDPKAFVHEVVIGPHNNQEACQQAIESFITADILNCEVRKSVLSVSP